MAQPSVLLAKRIYLSGNSIYPNQQQKIGVHFSDGLIAGQNRTFIFLFMYQCSFIGQAGKNSIFGLLFKPVFQSQFHHFRCNI